MAQILSGKEVAAQLTAHLTEEVEKLKQQGIVPKLALVRIGEHLSDVRYEKSAKNRCAKIGIATESYVLPPELPRTSWWPSSARSTTTPLSTAA